MNTQATSTGSSKWLMALIAGLIIGAVGVYGIMAYSQGEQAATTSQVTQEVQQLTDALAASEGKVAELGKELEDLKAATAADETASMDEQVAAKLAEAEAAIDLLSTDLEAATTELMEKDALLQQANDALADAANAAGAVVQDVTDAVVQEGVSAVEGVVQDLLNPEAANAEAAPSAE